jgi:AcrR family transcriptional regulator
MKPTPRSKTGLARSTRAARARPASAAAVRPRDVEATKQRLIDAVGAILARDGFSRLGVNAVAQRAGTDKALIYRYFGGMPALLGAYAESASFWPSIEEMAGGSLEELAALPLRARWERALHHYIAELRKRPLTQEILAWELSERNEVTARLEEVRERRGLVLSAVLARDVPSGVDVAALAGLFSGAVHYLLLRARKIRLFNGIDLHTEEGWLRLEAAGRAMVLGALRPQKR